MTHPRETVENATCTDVTGCTSPETGEVRVPANNLPKTATYPTCPGIAPPRSAKRDRQTWNQCRQCQFWYAAPIKELNRGRRVYCSIKCAGDHAAATGKFRGERNPRWLGGVANDNMRYRNRQKEREPVQEAARRQVAHAVRSGKLTRQPCEKCGLAKSEAHHDDYTKPLEVRWLCRTHHVEHHTAEREMAR